jgi:hypothetical protein
VSLIEPSHFDAATAYLVVDAHRLDDMHPYVWKTSDYGESWKSLARGLPEDVYLHAVREDPKRRGLLYLGTERGVTYSTDEGASWTTLKLGLPNVAVSDLVVAGDDLVLGTNGRSVWIFDDLTPLREMSPEIAAKDVHLFPARDAIRWRYHWERKDEGTFPNPPRGAVIHYFLKQKLYDEQEIRLEVLDTKGNLVKTLRSVAEPAETEPDDPDGWGEEPPKPALSKDAGVQRAVWDLSYEGALKIKNAKLDMGEPKEGPLALPGAYTLKLVVGDQTLETPLTVEPDPRVPLGLTELEEQLAFSLKLRDAITRLSQTVEQLRSVRQQVGERIELWKDRPETEALRQSAQQLIEALDALEAKLHNPKAEVVYDILAQKGGAQLYSRLAPLYSWVIDSDGPPTQGMREVFAAQAEELDAHAGAFDSLVSEDLAALNAKAAELALPMILLPKPPEQP